MGRSHQSTTAANASGRKLKLYKVVDKEEGREVLRQWARDNYKPFTPINGVWHWLVQEECTKINQATEVPSFDDVIGKQQL